MTVDNAIYFSYFEYLLNLCEASENDLGRCSLSKCTQPVTRLEPSMPTPERPVLKIGL
jgi:hypothetical protein